MNSYAQLKSFLREHRTVRDLHYGHRVLQEIERSNVAEVPKRVKVALLASHTIDFIVPLLKTELALNDLACDVYKPGFNQFRQDLLNPDSGLYDFNPEVTIVAFGLEDLVPDAVSQFSLLSQKDRHDVKAQIIDLCGTLIGSYRNSVSQGALLIQDFIAPWYVYDPLVRDDDGIHTFISQLNGELRQVVKRYANVHVLDYSRLAASRGVDSWTDPRTYYTARIPIAQNHWIALAETYARYIRAALNLEIKCIVLDLDNTLWGGVLGEDGFDGIALGDAYPGNVFRHFQEYLLGLYSTGYILAICSKNDQDEVIDVLRRHPSMVLREQHFAVIKANWAAKEQNIREISGEIQISPDHMLLVDDNLVEIEKVRSALPGVSCLHLQSPPLSFQKQFESARSIGKLLITDEDMNRGRQYSEDRQRRAHRNQLGSIEDFYRSLEQRLTAYVNHTPHRTRIAQLTQRTNQFNMTTVRLTETEVERMLVSDDYILITADLADRFGSSGTIAYIQIRKLEESWLIENFLMSCRVLGRTVEERLLDHVFAMARQAGIESIEARFIPTKKNAPFSDFYPRNGLVEVESTAGAEKQYMERVSGHNQRPAFIEIHLGG